MANYGPKAGGARNFPDRNFPAIPRDRNYPAPRAAVPAAADSKARERFKLHSGARWPSPRLRWDIVGNWQEDAPLIAFVGDAIFAGSMGNGNGAWDLARQKVREQILSLPAETLICPGHGPLTTVAEEKEHNPFFP